MSFDPTLIGTLGFPIVVSGYLLIKFERTLKDNTEATKEVLLYLKNTRNGK